jgi:plastocyanin
MEQAGTVPKTYMVSIEGLRFDPPTLTVNRGDQIVWVNKDLFPHTVTASAKAFDSRDIGPNASWTYVARTPGDYTYGCTYHPTMQGQLIVR